MRGIVAIEAGDPGEQILIPLARQQIAVIKRGAAEIGQQRIARAVHPYLVSAPHLDIAVEQTGLVSAANRHTIHPFCLDLKFGDPIRFGPGYLNTIYGLKTPLGHYMYFPAS
jgi:hypothetical protein